MKIQDTALMKLMLKSLIELHGHLKPFAGDVTAGVGGPKLPNEYQDALDRANRVIHAAMRRVGQCDWL